MKGIVACPQVPAVEAGHLMFEQGGNAVDAAVAAAFVQCVIDPLNASIGGFGVAQVRPSNAPQAEIIAFHGRAPLAARPDMFRALGSGASEPLASGTYVVEGHTNQLGYLAPTVPGTVKGLAELLKRFGRLDLATVLDPGIKIAGKGWLVTWDHWFDWTRQSPADRLDALSRFRATPEAARIYTNKGELWPIGSRVTNADYAETLQTIAAKGSEAFYAGDIARIIHNDFELNGGLITQADLENYDVEITSPVEKVYRGYRITSSPPPAGGLVVLEILNLLENFDLLALGHNTPDYVHVVAAAMRVAFEDMLKFLGDPAYTDVPTAAFLDKKATWNRIKATEPGQMAKIVDRGAEGGDTTQVVATDETGTFVSVTHSLGAASGVVTPGLGFIYNGQMHRFDPVPGRPNSIVSGKRRVTGMAPTIVWDQGRPLAALGAIGGNSIIVGVTQTILNLVDFGMTPLAAVSAPRFHCEGDVISLEGRFPERTVLDLQRMGNHVSISPYSYDRRLAAAAYVVSQAKDDSHGAADPRQGGVALGTVGRRAPSNGFLR